LFSEKVTELEEAKRRMKELDSSNNQVKMKPKEAGAKVANCSNASLRKNSKKLENQFQVNSISVNSENVRKKTSNSIHLTKTKNVLDGKKEGHLLTTCDSDMKVIDHNFEPQHKDGSPCQDSKFYQSNNKKAMENHYKTSVFSHKKNSSMKTKLVW